MIRIWGNVSVNHPPRLVVVAIQFDLIYMAPLTMDICHKAASHKHKKNPVILHLFRSVCTSNERACGASGEETLPEIDLSI